MIEVITTYYEFTHGKKPRGEGYWGFMFDKKTYDDVNEVWWAPRGMFQQAKQAAIEEARRRGARQVFVQS